MSATKSISIQQLSGAVHKAVSNVKVPATAKAAGPLAYINPGLICGLIYYGPIAEFPEAKTIAASIATEISTHAGERLAPIVQESAVGAQAAATPHLPPHIILGFQIKNLAVHF